MKRIIAMLFAALMLVLPMGLSAEEGVININIATAEELQSIDGVGEVKATAIVADREVNGPFANVDDLTRVKGIGQKTVDRNRERLTVGETQ